MTNIVVHTAIRWDTPCSPAEQARGLRELEAGNVLLFPRLDFPLRESETSLLSPAAASGRAKNISIDPAGGVLRGCDLDQPDREQLQGMMSRFAAMSAALICNLMPRYTAALRTGLGSYRPVEIDGRVTSWRADDTRLHVDSFPSRPVRGSRILRIFSNIHPLGKARTWRLGEPFEDLARRYVSTLRAPLPGVGVALNLVGITKARRSLYDHYMLQLHDRMKADLIYQAQAPQSRHEFMPGNTWLVFTDQVSHAAMNGQHALEQTFYLPVSAMQEPARSPLRVLERLLGQQLA